MPSLATDSCFEVALWFVEKARFEDNYLQAQKLQRMLWLAQGHYAATYHGRKLMPATFVARQLGPIESLTALHIWWQVDILSCARLRFLKVHVLAADSRQAVARILQRLSATLRRAVRERRQCAGDILKLLRREVGWQRLVRCSKMLQKRTGIACNGLKLLL